MHTCQVWEPHLRMVYLHHGDRLLPLWEVPRCYLRYLHVKPSASILRMRTCSYFTEHDLAHLPGRTH